MDKYVKPPFAKPPFRLSQKNFSLKQRVRHSENEGFGEETHRKGSSVTGS